MSAPESADAGAAVPRHEGLAEADEVPGLVVVEAGGADETLQLL